MNYFLVLVSSLLSLSVVCLADPLPDVSQLRELLLSSKKNSYHNLVNSEEQINDEPVRQLQKALRDTLQSLYRDKQATDVRKRVFCNGFFGCANGKRDSTRPIQEEKLANRLYDTDSTPRIKRPFCNTWGCYNGKRSLMDNFMEGFNKNSDSTETTETVEKLLINQATIPNLSRQDIIKAVKQMITINGDLPQVDKSICEVLCEIISMFDKDKLDFREQEKDNNALLLSYNKLNNNNKMYKHMLPKLPMYFGQLTPKRLVLSKYKQSSNKTKQTDKRDPGIPNFKVSGMFPSEREWFLNFKDKRAPGFLYPSNYKRAPGFLYPGSYKRAPGFLYPGSYKRAPGFLYRGNYKRAPGFFTPKRFAASNTVPLTGRRRRLDIGHTDKRDPGFPSGLLTDKRVSGRMFKGNPNFQASGRFPSEQVWFLNPTKFKDKRAPGFLYPGSYKRAPGFLYPGSNKRAPEFLYPGSNKRAPGFLYPGSYKRAPEFLYPGNDKRAPGFLYPGNYKRAPGFLYPVKYKRAPGFLYPVKYKRAPGFLYPVKYKREPEFFSPRVSTYKKASGFKFPEIPTDKRIPGLLFPKKIADKRAPGFLFPSKPTSGFKAKEEKRSYIDSAIFDYPQYIGQDQFLAKSGQGNNKAFRLSSDNIITQKVGDNKLQDFIFFAQSEEGVNPQSLGDLDKTPGAFVSRIGNQQLPPLQSYQSTVFPTETLLPYETPLRLGSYSTLDLDQAQDTIFGNLLQGFGNYKNGYRPTNGKRIVTRKFNSQYFPQKENESTRDKKLAAGNFKKPGVKNNIRFKSKRIACSNTQQCGGKLSTSSKDIILIKRSVDNSDHEGDQEQGTKNVKIRNTKLNDSTAPKNMNTIDQNNVSSQTLSYKKVQSASKHAQDKKDKTTDVEKVDKKQCGENQQKCLGR